MVVGMVVYLLRVKEGVDFEMERVVVVEDCEEESQGLSRKRYRELSLV